jgi:hypothetical protein
MLKFVKHHLETIEGVSFFPILSLLLFFGFFAGLIYWVVKQKPSHIKTLKNIPFETDK